MPSNAAAAAASVVLLAALLPAEAASPESVRDAYERFASTVASVRVIERNETVFGPSFETEKVYLGVFVSGASPDGELYALVPGRLRTESHKRVEIAAITVRLHDGTELPARYVAKDRSANVALVRVDAGPGTATACVDFGAHDSGPDVGDEILLHGRQGKSLFFSSCVHRGLVNGRVAAGEDAFTTIDTVTPGHLGALVTGRDGAVLGVVVEPVFAAETKAAAALASSADGGRAFGAPVCLGAPDVAAAVRRLFSASTSDPEPGAGWLGARVQALPRSVRQAAGLAPDGGALLVTQVTPGSPAEIATLAAGDLVTGIDGDPVPLGLLGLDVSRAVARGRKPGETVLLSVRRAGGEDATIGVHLREAPPGIDDVPVLRLPDAGLTARELTVYERVDRMLENEAGVLVLVADFAGPCGLAGVRPNDVVIEVDGAPIPTLGELRSAFAKGAAGRLIHVIRDGTRIVVGVPAR